MGLAFFYLCFKPYSPFFQLLKLSFSSSASQAQLLQFTSRMQLILVLFIQLISNNSKLRFSPATTAFSSQNGAPRQLT
ncbi:MAG: hypothetical protein ACJAYE_002018 [Candidatus Azotimanducaceae bacterium]|jgi:hypothetical protein